MRTTYLLFLLFASAHASSWFGAEPEYAKWSQNELRDWLAHHSIKTPSSFSKEELSALVRENWHHPPPESPSWADASRQWTYDQYNKAQQSFQNVRETSFDAWDESRLREWLLEQGVVAPSGPREQLIVLAKQKYKSYHDAASYYSSIASATASSLRSDATDMRHKASKSASSIAAQATHDASRALDDTKDYIYSTWDDNALRSWLEKNGVVHAKSAKTRTDLLELMREQYFKASEPVWEAWSDSYIREWLINHNLIKADHETSRANLYADMKKYYYTSQDTAWSTWHDSELKAWLVDHGLVKSDAQLSRDKLIRLVEQSARDNYASAADTIWSAWRDSDMRDWLVEQGYIKTDAQLKRDQLVSLMNQKYTDATHRSASYLVWPDARLRAFLREKGVSEAALPTSRPGLLQEVRIRWVQTTSRAEAIYVRLKEIINGGVEAAEEKLARVLEVLSGTSHETGRWVAEQAHHGKEWVDEKTGEGREWVDKKSTHGRKWGGGKVEKAGEDIKAGGEDVKGGGEKVQSAGAKGEL